MWIIGQLLSAKGIATRHTQRTVRSLGRMPSAWGFGYAPNRGQELYDVYDPIDQGDVFVSYPSSDEAVAVDLEFNITLHARARHDFRCLRLASTPPCHL